MEGAVTVADLTARLKLSRSTAHRLAAALVERRYLSYAAQDGYRLGPKLLELGYHARQQIVITRIVRPYLEALVRDTGHTVHLGIPHGSRVLYLDKMAGRRPIEISSRVGDTQPLTSTGLGKALILEQSESRWREIWANDNPNAAEKDFRTWVQRMNRYADCGYSFDLEENEKGIRCVGAPIHDANGDIVAAISISGAGRYMDDAHLVKLAAKLVPIVQDISCNLGWVSKSQA